MACVQPGPPQHPRQGRPAGRPPYGPPPSSGALTTAAVAGIVGGTAQVLMLVSGAYFLVLALTRLGAGGYLLAALGSMALRLAASAGMGVGGTMLLRRRPAGRTVVVIGSALTLLAAVVAFAGPVFTTGRFLLSPVTVVVQLPGLICAIIVLATVFAGSVTAALGGGAQPASSPYGGQPPGTWPGQDGPQGPWVPTVCPSPQDARGRPGGPGDPEQPGHPGTPPADGPYGGPSGAR